MSETAPQPAPARPDRWVDLLVFLAVVGVLLPLALTAVYHCDESNAMRHVSLFAEGDFTVPGRPGLLWMVLVPLIWIGEPAVVMTAGRVLSVLVAGLSAVLLVRLVSREAGRGGAVLGLILLFASPNFLAHAFEIRTDTFVLPIQLTLLLLFLRGDPRRGLWWMAGLLMGAALLISQKSLYFVAALHAAVFVHALIVRREGLLKGQVIALAGGDAIAVGAVLGWYGLLALLNGMAGEVVSENLRAAAATAFTSYPLDRKARGLWHAALQSPVLYTLFVVGLGVAFARLRRHPVICAMGVTGLLLLGTIFFHRGFFHYYVASMEPYYAMVVALLLGLGWKQRRSWLTVLVLLPVVGATVWGAMRWDLYRRVHKGYQESVMRSVAEIGGGDEVRVFDGIGLVPGYPQPGFFMTRGAREEYRDRHPGDGLIRLWVDPPVHVFVYDYMTRRKYLTPRERDHVWSHYLPYRDNTRLLGWRAKVKEGVQTLTTDIVVGGDHTVWFTGEWEGAATIAGEALVHGGTVTLEHGYRELVVDVTSGMGQLWLLWGTDRVPDEEAVDWSMFPILNRQRYQHYRKGGDLKTPRDDPSLKRNKRKKKRRSSDEIAG